MFAGFMAAAQPGVFRAGPPLLAGEHKAHGPPRLSGTLVDKVRKATERFKTSMSRSRKAGCRGVPA